MTPQMAKPINTLFKITFVCLFAYMVFFVLRLEISNFDSFSYMAIAKYYAGFRYFVDLEINNRPPLLPLLLTPVALLHHFGFTNKTLFTLMHLTLLPVTFAFVLAVHALLRRTLSEEYASLGALLILTQPGFLAYAFEPMVDLPSALLLTVVIIIYLQCRNTPSTRNVLLICLITGIGISLKNILVILPFMLACAEIVILAAHEGKGWKEILKYRFIYLVPVLSLFIYAVANVVANVPLHGWTLHNLSRIYLPFISRVEINSQQFKFDPTANFSFLTTQMTAPWFYLMVLGLFFSMKKKDPHNLTLWCWFTIYLFFVTILNWMYQYRLLFGVLPACYYFSLFALQVLDDKAEKFFDRARFYPWVRIFVIAALLVLPAMGFAKKIESLKGKIFSESFERLIAERADQLASKTANIFWLGPYYGIYQDGEPLLSKDMYYDIYHFGCNVISLFIDRPCHHWSIDSPYDFSRYVQDKDVLIYNSLPLNILTEVIPNLKVAELSPMMVGQVDRQELAFTGQQGNVKTFSIPGGKSRLVFTATDDINISINFEGNDIYYPIIFLLLKAKPSTGAKSKFPEKSVIFFNRGKGQGMVLVSSTDYFSRLEEAALLTYRADKFYMPGRE